MLKWFFASLAVLVAALVPSPPAYASPAAPAIPASQAFNMGAKTRAGYGGCTDSASLPAGSVAFSNVNYTGSHTLVFAATGASTSMDGLYKIDSHNCLVPAGTYGKAPGALTNGAYVLTDNNGATGTVNITVVANRWDVANIDAGTNADTISSNQLQNVIQATPGSGGPVMGDKIYLRCGMVYDPPKFDVINRTTGRATPGDIRIKRHDYAAQVTEYMTGNGGGAYTAKTLPDADWIQITDDTPGCATIRHARFDGTATQAIQGFWFTNLNFEIDYGGVNGFNQGVSPLAFGIGDANPQSFFRVSNSTFQGKTTVVGQRGQQGIFSTSVGGNGTSGCTTATVAFFDNHNGPANGSGAAATATISDGVITGWTQTATGSNYDTASSAAGAVPSGAGTWAVVTSDCSTKATAKANMNGLDIVTGIVGAAGAGSTELYIHDNTFIDMWDGVNLSGNQTAAYSTPTNFWIIGNTFNRPWTAAIQISNAAPVYSEWNFVANFKYASGDFHNDCEIRLYSGLVSGSTYPFGDVIGNICVRAQGQAGWADAQGWFMSNAAAGAVISGCKFEGNIYVGTFANGITLDNCDSTALVAFNTLVQDPATGITKPNHNGRAASSNAPLIGKYASSPTFTGTAQYNAVASSAHVWPGGAGTCNVASLGMGTSPASAGAYAAPPIDFTKLTTITAVSAAFQPKAAGTLVAGKLPSGNPRGSCSHNPGTGGYFDYTNRVSTAPF